ncbi:group III truncated hemoglobin [Spirosoma pulveris]
MADITNQADVERLVSAFYSRVFFDEEIGLIVTLVARVTPATHFRKIVDVWTRLLLSGATTPPDIIQQHVEQNLMPLLESVYFRRWQALFCSTVDELFSGPVAEQAKALTRQIESRPLTKTPAREPLALNP